MQTIEEHIKAALEIIKMFEQGSPKYELACYSLWALFDGSIQDTLKALIFKGPLHDGDVPSKSARDTLLLCGLASRVCVINKQGFTAANYAGWDVFYSHEHKK